MKYFKVYAKCGHVGRNNYLLKWLYIIASSKKEAASIARNTPRVKHDHKDAIRNVIEIDYDNYAEGLVELKNDLYFQVNNSSEQRKLNVLENCIIYREIKNIQYKKKRNGQRLRLENILKNEKNIFKGGYIYE